MSGRAIVRILGVLWRDLAAVVEAEVDALGERQRQQVTRDLARLIEIPPRVALCGGTVGAHGLGDLGVSLRCGWQCVRGVAQAHERLRSLGKTNREVI